MAITSIKVSVFEDHKRNTSTCYLKFNDIDEEIYLGFKFIDGDVSNYTNKAKTKSSRQSINGISATLTLELFKKQLHLNIGQDHYLIPLTKTGDSPLTAKGHWELTQDFNDWFNQQTGEQI
jgi:hypothetical protein